MHDYNTCMRMYYLHSRIFVYKSRFLIYIFQKKTPKLKNLKMNTPISNLEKSKNNVLSVSVIDDTENITFYINDIDTTIICSYLVPCCDVKS